MIRAADLPRPLADAFLDALEAWGELEHELFMTWQFLKRSPNLQDAWDEFSRKSTEQQRKSTRRLACDNLSRVDPNRSLPHVFDRLPHLTKIRDRIIHGRWHEIEVVSGDRKVTSEYLRIYEARGEFARPQDEAEERNMLGRSRFYVKELRAAQHQFLIGARELHTVRATLISNR
jgi:hypothetical protein